MQNQATPRAQAFARQLRTSLTDAEQRLWRGLRGEQLGVKFRRQHPLGSYIADFACLAPKLIVAVDGSQHAEQAAYDERRDAFLTAQGFEVLRFGSNDALSNTEGVLSVILERVEFLKAAALRRQVEGTPVEPRIAEDRGTPAPIPAFPQRGKEQDTTSARTDPALPLPPLGEGWDGGSSP